MKKSFFISSVFSVVFFSSCEVLNTDYLNGPKKTSELSTLPIVIYSLENTYKSIPNRCEVDRSSIIIKDDILKNEDIISYSESELSFTVTPEGYKRIQKLQDAQPFVLAVAGDVALIGFFKPFMSAGVCNHSVLMNFKDNNKVYFFLDNSTVLSEVEKKTKVNSEMLITALKESGRYKLN